MKVYTYNEKTFDSYDALRRAFAGVLPPSISDEQAKALGIEVQEINAPQSDDAFPAEDPDSVRSIRLQELDRAFLDYRASAVIETPMGFEIDAGDRALADVNGLLVLFEGTKDPINFMDAKNKLQSISYDDLKTIQRLIVANGARAYGVKWGFRSQLEKAKDSNAMWALKFDFAPTKEA